MIVDEPTPCYIPPGTKLLDPTAFDILIDHDRGQSPIWQFAAREANAMCNRCPVKKTCHTENADEEWLQALKSAADIESRACERCGRKFQLRLRGGRRRFCGDACWIANKRSIDTLADIPEDIRDYHAAFIRARAAGTAPEDIDPKIRAGEKTYQALRHQIRKARKAQGEAA